MYDFIEIEFEDTENACVIEECGCFTCEDGTVVLVDAFKKGKSLFAVRFMPQKMGKWEYKINGTTQRLKGFFSVGEPKHDWHGVVRANGDVFCFEDGTKFLPFGTTCYAWINQSSKLQDETVKTLKASCFNKVRMMIFPKSMPYNNEEPILFPFFKDETNSWQIDEIVPEFWDNLDKRMNQLREMNIQADLILFHPYDKWGFASLSQEEAMKYLAYCNARYGAFENIWWSLANEYEMLKRDISDWDQYGEYLFLNDPYHHLRSVHEILIIYPDRKWLTHLSLQHSAFDLIPQWKRKYGGKPVMIDECGYEGNIEYDWGNLTAFEMVNRVWWSVCRGGYCTHGETFHQNDEILWWSKGGVLHGESEPRIRFLKDILESLQGVGHTETTVFGKDPNHLDGNSDVNSYFVSLISKTPIENLFGIFGMDPKMLIGDNWCLRYYGRTCPCLSTLSLPKGNDYRAEIIDVWNMTRKSIDGIYKDGDVINLPGKEGMAVLFTSRKEF